MLSWGPPHDPYDMAPEAYKALFREREIVLRANVPEAQREAATEALRGYYAHIAALDDCIGRLLATLDETGLADETIFVFTSDHGDMLHSQGLRTKHCPWDEAIRVPLLLRLPGALGDEGRELALPLDAPDMMPTLLGLCDLAIPPSVEGRDLSPEILGEREPDEDAAAFLSVPVSYGMLRTQGLPAYRGLRTRRYTYARSTRGPWLLYDNEVDPYQLHNLIDDPAHAHLQARLEAQLQARLDRLGDAFLPGDAYLDRDHLTHYREATGPWGEVVTPWTVRESE
jgi:arylsulfatase A-like enzyme